MSGRALLGVLGVGLLGVSPQCGGTPPQKRGATAGWRHIVLGLAATSVLLSACGGAGTGTSPSGTAGETPKKGGSLTLSSQAEPVTLDPAIAFDLVGIAIDRCLYGKLYEYAAKPGAAGLELVPEMAAAMPTLSSDGRTYTIPLKHGVKFAPPVNREVVAADVKFSFERMMALPLCPGTYFYTNVVGARDYLAGKAEHISGFEAVDPYTVRITLEQPQLWFPKALSMAFCDIVPREWVERWGDKKFGRHPLGTGPFMFDHWTPAQEVVLKRNPNYSDPSRPYLDEIVFRFSVTPSRAALLLQRGEVDVLGDGLPAADVPHVTSDPQWEPYVSSFQPIGAFYLFLNVQFEPFDKVKVRQAMSWAIDREKLAKLSGGTVLPLYQVYPPGLPGHQPEKKWYGYDPAKAKQLLAEAGYPDGFTTTLYTDNAAESLRYAQAIQYQLAAIGVKASILQMSSDTLYALTTTPHKLSAGATVWYMDYPDPYDWIAPMFSRASAVEGGMNVSFWWSPTLEAMLVKAERMTDAKARIAEYQDMQAYIMEQAPYVTLGSPVLWTMHSKKVGGFYMHPVWGFDPRSYWVRWQS